MSAGDAALPRPAADAKTLEGEISQHVLNLRMLHSCHVPVLTICMIGSYAPSQRIRCRCYHVLAVLQKFAKAVLKVDTDGDFITLPELPSRLPPPVRNSMMVRACYRDIMDLMFMADEEWAASKRAASDDPFGMVVTGTPGIGKSTLALYLICCLAQRHMKVAYRCVRAVSCTAGNF